MDQRPGAGGGLAAAAAMSSAGLGRLSGEGSVAKGRAMVTDARTSEDRMALPQGDLGLLGSDVAQRLLTSTVPARNVLLVRGRASVTEVEGVVTEYALAARRYMGEESAAAYLAQIDQPGTKMARIAVRPTWVGVLDFQTRFPGGMTG